MDTYLYLVFGSGIIAMLFSFWKTNWINKQDQGTERMEKIGKAIADGAMAFLRAEYRVLAIFVVVVAILLAFLAPEGKNSWLVSVSFLIGALASGLAGFFSASLELAKEGILTIMQKKDFDILLIKGKK